MAGYRCVNFYDLCRLCSSVAGDKNIQIYSNETLLKKINECLSITLNDADQLPRIICPSCKEYIEIFSEFRKSCKNVQQMLESCLNSTKLRNGGQVYIKDEIPSKKVLKPIPNVNIQIATSPTTNSVKKNVITQNPPDFLSSIMQAVGIQTVEEVTENCANLSQQNFQQQQMAIQSLPQYTLTLDTVKPGQIQYKIENASNLLGQSPTIIAKNLQNQQVTLNHVDEFLKNKPAIIVKKEVPIDDTKDKRAKFNLILKPQQKPIQKIQPSQIVSTTKRTLSTQNHKAQILNIEKILPVANQTSPTKQVVVPVMIRTNNDGRIGDAKKQLLTQAIAGNHGTENKASIQQPFFMQMKLQSNSDGQFTFTPAAAAPHQIQLSLSPQQLQQISYQTTHAQSSQPALQTQNVSTVQDIQTQTIVQESHENNEEEIFSDTFENDYYPGEEESEFHEDPEKNFNNVTDKKTPSKKTLKTIKPVKLKTKLDIATNNDIPTINPQHSEMAKKQLNLITSYNNNTSKRIENETIDKTSDISLTVCDVCKKVFKRKEFLMQHLKSHIGLRPFKCEESQCNKSFSRKEHLLRHISSHTGKKEFTCNICNKLFSRKDNLNKHRR
ncbi:hypothetical protein ACKWTF_007598 [Chironomus riparius]